MVLVAMLQDAFLDKHGVKLGFMSAFVKASADALQVLNLPVTMLKLYLIYGALLQLHKLFI